jgi:hypothetical protein
MPSMKELVEAFEIFMKYNPDQWLEGAEHDVIYGPAESDVDGLTDKDKERLDKLGWHIDKDFGGWYHYV